MIDQAIEWDIEQMLNYLSTVDELTPARLKAAKNVVFQHAFWLSGSYARSEKAERDFLARIRGENKTGTEKPTSGHPAVQAYHRRRIANARPGVPLAGYDRVRRLGAA